MTGDQRAAALASAFDQDTLRLISYALHYTIGAGGLAPVERVLIRPALLALADAIDDDGKRHDHDAPAVGRHRADELVAVPRLLIDLLHQIPEPRGSGTPQATKETHDADPDPRL